jgi:serine protease
MGRFRLAAFWILTTATYSWSATTAPAVQEIVVKLRPGPTQDVIDPSPIGGAQLDEIVKASGLTLTPTTFTRDGAQRLSLSDPADPETLRASLNAIRTLPNVLYADVQQPSVNLSTALSAGTADVEPQVTQLVVRMRDRSSWSDSDNGLPMPRATVNKLSSIAGLVLTHQKPTSGGAYLLGLPVALPLADALAVTARLEANSSVLYADPVGRAVAALTPNDQFFPNQWDFWEPLAGAFLTAAWDMTTGSPGIVVAVVDTGARYDHPDLAGRLLPGYDFISDLTSAGDNDGPDPDASDTGDWHPPGLCYPGDPGGLPFSSWHGTHVAGTIGAATNNGIGVSGGNWVSKLLPVRVLGRCGGIDVDIVNGILWAAGLPVAGAPPNPTPARVLNLSLGGTTPRPCPLNEQAAIDEALNRGALVVVAAGNSAADASLYPPANCNGVLAVAATDRLGNKAPYSNFGSAVAVSAPGGTTSSPAVCDTTSTNGILSTRNLGVTTPGQSGYCYFQGTSQATPHVSAVASLVLSANPSLTASQVAARILATASFPAGSDCLLFGDCGSGIVNAAAAVSAAAASSCTPSDTALCVQGGRFKVEVAWSDFADTPGVGKVALALADSGLFYFYGPDNAEILIKVLNGCGDPNFPNYWVFGAAATTFEYTITVTDTKTGAIKSYHNSKGNASAAIADVNAFPTCP